ncbi:MAG TPA: NAD-dependent malic enzyme [Bryobacteraceae bacterium]|nr:NAD-dependent malic enzyme [Bryobacteraceae bacterium]
MSAASPVVRNRGIELLRDPKSNKSTAFTEAEREESGLTGLLPAGVDTEDTQVQRALQQIGDKPTDLERYIYLMALLDANETLFYKVVMSDPARFLPILYDPTVGEACLKFGHIFRRPRGMYVSLKQKGSVREVLKNWPVKDVRVICITSGERILGLGDLGANGMGIPIGKLQLYTACAAVPPQYLLPIHIDFGTNNQELLSDPLYLGLRQPRVSIVERDEFVDEFVQAVQDAFPGCCIHFEDWAGVDAERLLARYRDEVCCYNDDIQGTAGVVLTGILSALRVTGGKLGDQRILFLGAGSAGIGIADLIASAMTLQGLTEEQARDRISLFDINGLLEPGRTDLFDFQKPYAHPHAPSRDFVSVIEDLRPTAIIGVSTKGKAFTQKVVETMSRINQRPIIFALSNPTEHSECTAEEAYRWSDGRALFAAGVQFQPVRYNGKTLLPGQGNNLYIFPAVGLAIYATRARRVTDEMFIAAAQAVADQISQDELDAGLLYPPQSNILETETATAQRVSEVIFDRGLAGVKRPKDLLAYLESQLYKPEYPDVTTPE